MSEHSHPPDPSAAHAAPPQQSDSELAREQDYLISARAEMARMREHTLGLQAQAGDKIAGEHLAHTLWRRAQSLVDDPGGTLFFGRIDTLSRQHGTERHYIGRRHISDADGEPVVVDWRADVSTPFYRASPREPMGVRLRRRFGVDRGQLTAYEDEHLSDPQAEDLSGQRHSRILAAEIERPRSGPMRDIVATIQPEQDEIVRADVGTTICVQGAPGTGKTAVGLHRAAWLLYSYRDRLSRTGVLVIGPNRAFLEHVGAVLPTLGEIEVGHTTVEELTGRSHGTEPAEVATLKGDARLAQVLHRAVWSQVQPASEPLVVPRGSRRWRVPEYDVQQILDELTSRGVRYDAARQMLPRRLAHAVLVRMEGSGDTPDDRVQDAVARSKPVRDFAKTVWPVLDPPAVLFGLWSDPAALAAAADDLLTGDEQRILLWEKAPRTRGAARWTPADTVLLDEIGDILERTTSLGHLIVDEAQDLSPMQLRAVGRRASTGSLTVLGDLAQGTTPWATRSWTESLEHLGKAGAHVEELTRGFRVPAAVIEYAARLLPHIAAGLALPESVRSNPGRLDLLSADGRLLPATVAAVRSSLEGAPGTVGVIVSDTSLTSVAGALQEAGIRHATVGGPPPGPGTDAGTDAETDAMEVSEARVQLVPATLAKGLEFDQVIVVEPAAIVAAEPDERTGLRRLYVVLTRAVSGLTVVHDDPLPAALREN
ncbi:AAA family ATPase [Ornithinimicrobium ciconiae]|uniref:AAA family ATPase n=1 Tax=Ornithinimicrobium ciconiae TaxID=2594265 RepID=A0A516G840_9MICO|nr:AAA family ATPase [Ornithinimicrobium ciconiae]QDO87693.1 AAA family ATPase [Ornithinimicrobium ciconiae]